MDNTVVVCLLFLVLSLGGCEGRKNDFTTKHRIIVPQRYQIGRTYFAAPSDYERYVRAYEDGWWKCIENYKNNIDYVSSGSDYQWNGWPAEVEGYCKGYQGSEERILNWIRLYGKMETKRYLVEIWKGV